MQENCSRQQGKKIFLYFLRSLLVSTLSSESDTLLVLEIKGKASKLE